ncbi:MAG: hypothetical protein HKP59_06615 [Lutibacter sp.]|uniref:carboxypeptidase-like regulatory domain-containing protein n=1 Tax=Lutibacter sp. TaxID=1925666 RepID=UPI001824700F|nr:carboxypeptidase-like regulatory domain-containing protein [Lutibacter sp.]MBT8317279.1 carboxypeptidase-like regulatory domain-containing protein [Lutibacter sp.]NNJ58138.1 hypothetical protein [Lutibacter sp.]
MKKLVYYFLFFSIIAHSQEIKRENINAKIIVEGSNMDGITIYNSSTKVGVITNNKGEFTIAVAPEDLLEVRALGYQQFDFVVNDAILESRNMNIILIEEINKLDEVVITNKRLTGNIRTDIKNITTFSPKQDAMYFGIKNRNSLDLNDANIDPNKRIGLESQPKRMINGLNIVNVVDQLLLPLFRFEVKDKKAAGIPEVPVESIKYYLASNFLIDNFNIPEHRVEEFIRYVEDDVFDVDLLNYGHELELLELLNKKSKMFLVTSSAMD